MDPIHIQLISITIFWKEDLGFSAKEYNTDRLAEWWDTEVQPWLDVAIKGHYNPHPSGVWFADPREAALFKLRFARQMPL